MALPTKCQSQDSVQLLGQAERTKKGGGREGTEEGLIEGLFAGKTSEASLVWQDKDMEGGKSIIPRCQEQIDQSLRGVILMKNLFSCLTCV